MAQAGERGQSFGQLHHGRVREAGQHHMVQPGELLGERGLDVRMAVAEEVDPPGADAIQVAASFGVVEPGALGTRDGDGGAASCRFIWVQGCHTAARLRAASD